jgi:anthranilate phosphoribosyltransferase
VADGGLAPAAALARLIARQDLTRGDVETLFGRLMDGELDEPTKAALLMGLAVKGETAQEIAGAAAAMRRRVIPIPHRREGVIDTCGTGGDGKGTFNISTAAAFVAAAAGAPVAKHGNRSVSSRSGSADVLTALGVEVGVPPERAAAALDEIGIAFLFAPALHPAMREVMPVRTALGVRTVFNLLGPLTNPAGARRQLLGVFARQRVPMLAAVLAELGSEHAMVVHGSDGLDEITLTGPTHVAELRDGAVREYDLDPADLGFERVVPEDLAGGEPIANAAALERVLAGEPGPLAEITVLNAGAAIYVGGLAPDLASGVAAARRAVAGGGAAAKLDALREIYAG